MARWERSFPEPHTVEGDERLRTGGRPTSFVCVDCAWCGVGATGYDHHAATGHAIRIRNSPPDWPNMKFSDADAEGRRRQLAEIRQE